MEPEHRPPLTSFHQLLGLLVRMGPLPVQILPTCHVQPRSPCVERWYTTGMDGAVQQEEKYIYFPENIVERFAGICGRDDDSGRLEPLFMLKKRTSMYRRATSYRP